MVGLFAMIRGIEASFCSFVTGEAQRAEPCRTPEPPARLADLNALRPRRHPPLRLNATSLALAIALPVLVTAAPAHAQTETKTTDSPLAQPTNPLQPLPASGTEGGYFFNLRPLGASLGKTLADYGVYLTGRHISEEIGAVGGGIKRGGFFEGYTSMGVDLDMQRIANIPGGTVHLLISDLQGQPYYSYSGSAYAYNRVFVYGPDFRLNELSYEQSLFQNKLNVRVGRVTTGTEFDNSELYCTFISSLCSTPAGYTFDKGYPAYVASSWGAVGQVKLPYNLYFNAAVYENEPVESLQNHPGFPGRDWGLNYANGATYPAQFGYRTTLANDQYPRAYSVGGFYDTSKYNDPLLNTLGRNRILFRGTTKLDIGRSEVYFQAQQMVYRPDGSDRGLTLFGGANWATSGEPAIDRDVFAGAYYKGPFASRPNDTVGAAVTYIGLNPRVTDRIDSVLSRSTRGQSSKSEISYQINYGLAVAPGVMFKPFFEFISHPDQIASAVPSGNNTHAEFVGAAFTLLIPETFGLPRLLRQ